ncbi:MAG: 50S ribosomal protein L18 [Deltaproteobacteria bacterium CG_4_10_14_0_2_um_filter_43_8]|nr:MAG: 50S ribosomal protein L18 [Deltaproteobacteria bacterium CG11_big_fil_rev_8_21_14_0_20_42_23]PJA21593.1 MAG: 50S ribosomal protein L18 [Deltaproteobacteria bacterium CG_4_10_14_0_2_um_filter_43_8]PJC64621.1 MAG: 50S ribosomal protein L18 [Deltaproteobacteria bacterium CG_4_9_14_0_2_um_filter_42_21]
MKLSRTQSRHKRKLRIRKKVNGTPARPRLSVYKSLKNISAQLIDDTTGTTLVSVATAEKELNTLKEKASCVGAKKVGELLAERAKTKGIETIVFDRSGYRYHGRVKALAEAAREKGLRF